MTIHPTRNQRCHPHDIWLLRSHLASPAEVKKAIVKNMENSSITFEEAENHLMARLFTSLNGPFFLRCLDGEIVEIYVLE